MDIQQDSTHIPQIEDFYAVIHNKLFEKFLQAMKDSFSCEPQMEFSRCTWEYGWNMKAAYIRISGSCLPYVQAAMILQSLTEKERHTKRHGFLEKIPCFFVSCSMR